MKSEFKILIAFVLNLFFSVFEFFGGALTGSVAIISDAVHDFGDAITILVSFLLEKKSKREADVKYTYGYSRYSLLGCVITCIILLLGSVIVIYNAILRIITPEPINYNGMIVFAVVGVIVNFVAVFFTRGGGSLNQKAVNLHMLEDVLGWVVVLIGAIVMRFTDFSYLDSIMSICLAVFIVINALKNLLEVVNVFLEKAPKDIDVKKLCDELNGIEGVSDVHHFHLRSFDGINNCATMHVVTDSEGSIIRGRVREFLKANGVEHSTIEIESVNEVCADKICKLEAENNSRHKHHHHH